MRTDNHTSPYNFFPKNLRGQFYLIATIIIIAVIIGFVTISNYAQKQGYVMIYDLGEEMNIEGENILDYGIYNSLDKNAIAGILKNFAETYTAYIEEEIGIYLLIGDENSIFVIMREDLEEGLGIIGFTTGLAIKEFVKKEYFPIETFVIGDDIKVRINEDEYVFELKPGENFYFIILQEANDEKHVFTN